MAVAPCDRRDIADARKVLVRLLDAERVEQIDVERCSHLTPGWRGHGQAWVRTWSWMRMRSSWSVEDGHRWGCCWKPPRRTRHECRAAGTRTWSPAAEVARSRGVPPVLDATEVSSRGRAIPGAVWL